VGEPVPGAGPHRAASDLPLWASFGGLTAAWLLLISAIVVATMIYPMATPTGLIGHLRQAFTDVDSRSAIELTMLTCTLSAVLSLVIAVPVGWLLARTRFPGKALVDALCDVPIVLPPLVIGLTMLILTRTPPGIAIENAMQATLGTRLQFAVPGIVLAMVVVGAAFAVRVMRSTFDHLSPRPEQVAMTLGASRWQSFWLVAFPGARRGMITAGTLAWARCLGEFGPIMVFAGMTPRRTEVMSTRLFLHISVGELEKAMAVAFLMVLLALVVLTLARLWGDRGVHP